MHTLNYLSSFLELSSVLSEYQNIWQNEVMFTYPHYRQFFPPSWLDAVRKLTHQELYLWRVQKKTNCLQDQSLHSLLQFIHNFSPFLPFPPHSPKLNFLPRHFRHIRGKKKHEIERLLAFLTPYFKEENFDGFIDIGGGVGHLAHYLSCEFQVPGISLDQNRQFQQKGKISPLVSFHHCTLHQDNHKDLIEVISSQNNLKNKKLIAIGLHTCGPLANDHLRFLDRDFRSDNITISAVLNFGCCYEKLAEKKNYNLSAWGKKSGLTFSPSALTLGQRSHNFESPADFEFKIRVKTYRFLFYLWLKSYFPEKKHLSLGNSPRALYRENFSQYAACQWEKLGMKQTPISQKNWEDFYEDAKNISEVKDMILAHLLREEFGPLVECYLLLDRVLFLQEKGKDPDLYQLFDPVVSPRSLAIFALK